MKSRKLQNKNLEILRQKWQGFKILILGFGQEGKDSFLFLKKMFPEKVLGIADQEEFLITNFKFLKIIKKDKNIRLHLGRDYLKAIGDYDLVIKSPGMPIHLPEVKKAFQQGKITSAAEIFLNHCPSKIIGVTGTKGKGSTALMIYKILKENNIKAHLIGNIGQPVLNYLFSAKKENVYVYELSSHQLYNLKKSPPIAVFLNLFADHLDYYKDFKEYVRAKANIALYQTKDDYLVYNAEDKIIKKIALKSKAKKIPIKGKYYNLNKAAAKAVARIFKINSRASERALKKGKLLPHRLELVGAFKGIAFYNDSASTIPQSAIAAVKTLGKRVETIILGGSDKKANFKELAQIILQSKIKNIILFPTTGRQIQQAIVRQNNKKKGKGRINYFFVETAMNEAVNLAYKHTARGKICLLSPASASFSIFKNYKQRGNLFKKHVRALGKDQL